MTAEPTRYQFGVRVDDPAQALADLASTPAIVDDIAAVLDRIDQGTHAGVLPMDIAEYEDLCNVRRELRILRRRLEAIHARLAT